MLVCMCCLYFFFFKQKTAYEVRISDWSSDVCSSDLLGRGFGEREIGGAQPEHDVVAFEIGLEEGLERVFEVPHMDAAVDDEAFEIGRESCRERVCQYV